MMQKESRKRKLGEESKTNKILDLSDSGARRKYIDPKRSPQMYKKLHWGQLKLLVEELVFLTMTRESKAKRVVYAGAAPGLSMPYLSEMFPDLTFDLFDPAMFFIKSSERIQIFNRTFTDDDAKGYTETETIFLSDIRSGESEKEIESDMNSQRRWVEIMKPKFSSLKFRLPFNNTTTKYLGGQLYIQAFAPVASTELRLVFSDIAEKTYNNAEVEERMAYHNQVVRQASVERTSCGLQLNKIFDKIPFLNFDFLLFAEALLDYRRSQNLPCSASDLQKDILRVLVLLSPKRKIFHLTF